MSPDGVCTVQRSWADLRSRRSQMLAALTEAIEWRGTPIPGVAPAERAAWVMSAVQELVGLLAEPSSLELRARQIVGTWPGVTGDHPTDACDGCAWMDAVAVCSPAWTEAVDRAWRQAWLMLADVLAADTLAPFCDGPHC